MNPFLTSRHSLSKVTKRSWSILLQTVKGASRSFILCSSLLILTSPTTLAQQNGIDQDSEIITTPAGDRFLRWYGHVGRSYFIQVSNQNDPLGKWNWAPLIEGGADGYIEHLIGGTAPKAFVRLKYTSLTPGPNETLDTADFDQDGLSNLAEIAPPPPLLASAATDPLDPDTDHDGLTDGYERTNGLDPNDPGTTNPDNGPNGDPDGDGLTNAEELALGTLPGNSNSDGDKLDGNDLLDGEDAVPLDAEINWKKTPESKYVWIEQVTENQPAHTPTSVNKNGMIIFRNNDTNGFASFEHNLWDSAAKSWVILPESGSQTIQTINGSVTCDSKAQYLCDINDDGTVFGLSEVKDFEPNENPAYPPGRIIVAGMIWKRSGNSPTYGTPTYFTPTSPITTPISQINSGLTGNSHVRKGLIANDGSVNTWAQLNESQNWMIYDSSQAGTTMRNVKALLPTSNSIVEGFPGAILDKNRAIFVQTEILTNVEKVFLSEEGLEPHEITFMWNSNPEPKGEETDLSLAPNLKDDQTDRLWIATGNKVYLEKTTGGSGEARWHTPPTMFLGADFLHSSGIAVKRKQSFNFGAPSTFPPRLWRNGKYSTLDHHVSKPSTVEITDVIDLASNGIILVTATESDVKKTGLLAPVAFRGYVHKNKLETVGISKGNAVQEMKREIITDSTDYTGYKTEAKSELKIAQWSHDSIFDANNNQAFNHGNFKYDPDAFRIRLPDVTPLPVGSTEHRIKFWTVDAAGNTLDEGALVDLNVKDGFHETAALCLVTDDSTDDQFAVEGKADGALGDRTYRAMLGGKLKFQWLTFPGPGDDPIFEIPIPIKKTVTAKGFNVNGSTTTANATFYFERARKQLAACGVQLDYSVVDVPAPADVSFGAFSEFTLPDFVGDVEITMNPEPTALMKGCKPPAGVIPVYFVRNFDESFRGWSNASSLMASADAVYGGAIFLDSPTLNESTLAHEFLHILLDASHGDVDPLWFDAHTYRSWCLWYQKPLIDPIEIGISARRRILDTMRSRILKSTYCK